MIACKVTFGEGALEALGEYWMMLHFAITIKSIYSFLIYTYVYNVFIKVILCMTNKKLIHTVIKSDKYNFKIPRIFLNLLDLCASCVFESNFKKHLNASGKCIIHSCITPLNTKHNF